jgi:glycerol-3-phosphate cytidylyltransferase
MEKTVITYGTFDLFHNGHYALLERAKKLGNFLIVGVTSDNYDKTRGKLNVKQTLSQRIENVKESNLADLIIVEEYEGQKIEDIQKHNIDIFTVGSDWIGKFDYLENYCQVVYLERTKGISSTLLRNNEKGILKIGLVGNGRISKRFVNESKFVSSVSVDFVYGRNKIELNKFAKEHELIAIDSFDKLIKHVDAVYIATTHNTHYEFAKNALLNNKHVICEKPIVLKKYELEELITIAKNNNLILLEALKTAYMPTFIKLINLLKTGIIGDVLDVTASFTRLIINDSLREFNIDDGGSFNELASYVLLPIVKLLGTNYDNIDFHVINNQKNIDIYSKVHFKYNNKFASVTTALKGKRENDLVISGTKGYIYVPSPWWNINYFEVRNDNGAIVQRFSDKLDGDGLRYEIAEFVNLINENKPKNFKFTFNEMLFIVSIIEKFNDYTTNE